MAIRSIYLSPHSDDAALSCGGHIARQTRNGQRALVVTVCTGPPPIQLVDSDFVRELHTRWAVDDPIAARRAEDLAALRALRAEALHLNVPDCIYRIDAQTGQPLYPNRAAIFGTLASQETRLIDELAHQLQRLEPLCGTTIYAPLCVGNHVDHQLVRAAAERWGAPGGQLVYYEDYPYAQDPAAVKAALALNAMDPMLIELDEADLSEKIAAVACYQSQLSTFFADGAEMARQLEAFARFCGGGEKMAERLWQPQIGSLQF